MALNYQIFDKIDRHFKSGYIVVMVDRNKVAKFVRQQSNTNVNNGELIIFYKKHKGRFTIGADNYFFQEGSGPKYEKAKYGLLKIDSEGNSILIGLCDDNGQLIE